MAILSSQSKVFIRRTGEGNHEHRHGNVNCVRDVADPRIISAAVHDSNFVSSKNVADPPKVHRNYLIAVDMFILISSNLSVAAAVNRNDLLTVLVKTKKEK